MWNLSKKPKPVVVRFRGHKCLIRLHHYLLDDRLALQLVDHRTLDCVTFATINLPELELRPGEVFIKDYDENDELARFLYEAKVIEPPLSEDILWGLRCKLAIDIPKNFEEGAFLMRVPKERNRELNVGITR